MQNGRFRYPLLVIEELLHFITATTINENIVTFDLVIETM